jgi:hypothetical protein
MILFLIEIKNKAVKRYIIYQFSLLDKFISNQNQRDNG